MHKTSTIKVFRDFTKDLLLYLETKDTRLFVHPYGPMYDDAEGRLLKVYPGGAGPEDSEFTVGYVKTIIPELPERWTYPIKVIAQEVSLEGNLFLFAKIRHNKLSVKEISDLHNTDGKIIMIELYGDSAKTFVFKKE